MDARGSFGTTREDPPRTMRADRGGSSHSERTCCPRQTHEQHNPHDVEQARYIAPIDRAELVLVLASIACHASRLAGATHGRLAVGFIDRR